MNRTALYAACIVLAAASVAVGQSSGFPTSPGAAPSAPPSTPPSSLPAGATSGASPTAPVGTAPVGTAPVGTAPVAPPASGASAAIGDNWRAADPATPRENAPTNPAATSLDAQSAPSAAPAVPVRSGGKDMLPNDQGQVWQQYDISAYTANVKGVAAPEQAIVDWILRETGTEVWFRPPLGLLNATSSTISVYHTPEMQKVVADVIGRFVNGTQDPHVLGLRVVAIDNPSWRSTFMVRMRPVAVQAPGINAWLLSKEDASLLLAQMRSRADFREHAAPSMVFYNGQSQTISTLRPRVYVRGYRSRTQDNTWTGYDIDRGQIQEGFSLEVSPLLSQDERTIDAVLKVNIDQVEKLVNVGVDLPGFSGQMQRADIQVPQMVSWRLHERFRWPSSQVLLLSCGVIASPGPDRQATLGIPSLFGKTGGRSDALLFVENLGKASQALVTGNTTTLGGGSGQPGARY